MIFEKALLDDIVKYLVENGSKTNLEILSYLQKHHSVSRQNFYKIIDQLLQRQVLAKGNKQVMLNAIWMMEYVHLGESMKELLNESLVFHRLEEGEIQRFEGSSLEAIDALGRDLLLRIIARSNEHEVYHYQSHPYHILAFPSTEQQFRASLKSTKTQNVLVYGNDSYLDRYGADFVRMYGGARAHHKHHKDLAQDGYIVAIVGDWIIERYLPEQLSNTLRFFFDTTTSITSFHPELYRSLFQQKHQILITVERNAKRTKKLKSIIAGLNSKK